MTDSQTDLFIIGGGVNGCGIARDAAGRGLSVCLAEMNDLGSATSSASSKLFHGGLRYLEYFEFRLVREALKEREILLRAMPHISWPMRFVLPYHEDMRFESETPTSRFLSFLMPWQKGARPAWLIRFGLFLYDTLGKREILPGTQGYSLEARQVGTPIDPKFETAFEYSDCWIEDSRLVILNARDAQAHGAEILVRTKVISARRENDLWRVETQDTDTGKIKVHWAKMLVNAGGPWVGDIIEDVIDVDSNEGVRLVRGSHIVTKKLFEHDKCYFFQGTDGRIIFAIPYEGDYTLIGTTDADHTDASDAPVCTDEERDYLIDFVNDYLSKPVSPEDVVWSYSGVRPLYDDGASSATAATRDYVLKVDEEGAPVLNIFGGKITTYRKLSESALDEIGRFLNVGNPWTATAALPGGDFPVDGFETLVEDLQQSYPFLNTTWATRLIRAYGTEAWGLMAAVRGENEMGENFGANLTAHEVDWLMDREFAFTAEDVLWRRSKLGLKIGKSGASALEAYMKHRRETAAAA